MKSNKLKREPKYIAKFKAFPYQQEAVDAVKDLEYAAIFHEQGLGKTKIAIDVLLYWLSECSMDTALIVTKKQLVANWVNEFKDHTSIKPAVLNTDKNNNYRIFCGPYRVVLTNFETLETEKQQFELYLKVRNVGIIIDESAKLKNPNSKLTKTYFELAPLFQRRIIMTGTPVANRPYDIWAQIYFLDFGESLGADFNEFKKETDLSNKLSRNTDLQEEFEDNISQIFNRIRAGIDHMSNYLLYNGEDFTGKGHSYHADTPEDLFYRMHLTMELGENLTEELGRKIAIFSFPMRYIPLDNDQRGFIGANWNAKYLRALQCMLIPTQGKGIQGRSFFEADFGKTAEDFVMYLAMPERLLNKRGHFVERKDEPKFEREIRYTQWSENRHLIDTWMKYYSMFEKDTVLEYIGCNRFSVETLDKIENEELKKLYFLYLTPSATIRVFSDCTEDTKRIISTFILEELPFMYSRIVETILSSKPGYKVIAGILENFGEKVCTDLLKKIDLFSGHDNDKLTMLIKANKSKRLVDFDFSLLQFIPYFHVSNLLSKQEEQIIMNSAYELKEAPIRKILLLHLDELKDVLIKTNGAQPGDTQIISVIEEQIKELYHQISIFEL